jgi:hypothetical protein
MGEASFIIFNSFTWLLCKQRRGIEGVSIR